mgnify:FL=1|tara:strand:+ start:1583 stop:2416 length:834 start_codon:yes stop_codon:yes gene_type:complete
MGYVGNEPSVNFTSFAKQDITGDGGGNYTLTHAVANANEIAVYVNNVRQEPTDAYSVNGTALSMTGNVASSDNFYVIYLGKALQTTVPPDSSVSTAKIADSAVTNAKISNSTIDLTSKVTGVLPVANGGNGFSTRPLFRVKQTSDQTIAHATATTFQFDNKTASGAFDIGNYFNTSNYRYEPLVAGYYWFGATVKIKSSTPDYVIIYMRKNGSTIYKNIGVESNAANAHISAHVSGIIHMNGSSDYIDIQVQHNVGANADTNSNFDDSNFNGYLIGA